MHQSLPREVHIHFFPSSTICFSLFLTQTPAAVLSVVSSVSQIHPSSRIPTLAYSLQISRHLKIHPISSPSRKASQAIAGSRGHSFPWRPNCVSSLFSVTLHLMSELHIQSQFAKEAANNLFCNQASNTYLINVIMNW